jgi:hypothetical protein
VRQFNIEMEDVKEIEQRVLNTLGMSKSRPRTHRPSLFSMSTFP